MLSILAVRNGKIRYLTDFIGQNNCKMSDNVLFHFPNGFGHCLALLSLKKRHFSR